MAEVKWVKLPTNFFEREPMRFLHKFPDGDALILLYLQLLLESYREGGKGKLMLGNIDLTDEVINAIFFNAYDNIGEKLQVLEDYGLIDRRLKSIQVYKFWIGKHNRNTDMYKQWRKEVFIRDNFQCQHCGTRKDLQAHHKETWMSREDLRYDVSNGITLCRDCHLKAHGGRWNNG